MVRVLCGHKIHRTPFLKTARRKYDKLLQLVGVDQAGPFRIRDPQGRRFFLLVIDYSTNYTVIYRQRNKSALSPDLQHFIDMAERQHQPNKVVTIIGDGALVGYVKSKLEQLGIQVITTAPGSSESNGKIERRIRTVVEAARAMMALAHLPPTFFLHACVYAVYILNITPDGRNARSKLAPERNLSALELWQNQDLGSTESLLKQLRIFGCLAYAILPGVNTVQGKQSKEGERCVMLGISANNDKNYQLYSLDRCKPVEARSVVTNEILFPYGSPSGAHPTPRPTPGAPDAQDIDLPPQPRDVQRCWTRLSSGGRKLQALKRCYPTI